jgi:hypothetical protein
MQRKLGAHESQGGKYGEYGDAILRAGVVHSDFLSLKRSIKNSVASLDARIGVRT